MYAVTWGWPGYVFAHQDITANMAITSPHPIIVLKKFWSLYGSKIGQSGEGFEDRWLKN